LYFWTNPVRAAGATSATGRPDCMGEAEKHQIFLQITRIRTVRISPKLRRCKQNAGEIGGFGRRRPG